MFAQARANPALLLAPQLQLQTQCYSLTSHNPAGQAYITYQSQFVGWIPSKSTLQRAGVHGTGFWPANKSQFQAAAIQKAFPGGARGAIAFAGQDANFSSSALIARLAAIKECDTGLGKPAR